MVTSSLPSHLLSISDDLAPRLIQSTSRTVRNREKKNFEKMVSRDFDKYSIFKNNSTLVVCLSFSKCQDFLHVYNQNRTYLLFKQEYGACPQKY